AFAPEMDEADRVVDAPVERKRPAPSRAPMPTRASMPPPAAEAPKPLPTTSTANGAQEQPATEQQLISIRKLCAALGKPEPESGLDYQQARTLITQLSGEYQ